MFRLFLLYKHEIGKYDILWVHEPESMHSINVR